MASTTSVFRAARPIFNQQQTMFGARAAFRNGPARVRFFREQSRRWQSSSAEAEGQAAQSWFKRMWESPVGIKTVHFWAPVMKWGIVIAGISDFFRPAENLSVTQNFALTCTGLIWTRWCFVITPKNMLLAAVNFFMGCVGVIQLSRIGMYHQSKNESAAEVAQDVKQDAKANAPTPVKENA